MKKTFIFLMLSSFLLIILSGNVYAEDSLIDNSLAEVFPEPPEISEKAVKFEPDPNDFDSDGLSNADEEKYGTDPNDPDTDNDGLTDSIEITNGTDPNNKGTTGYLEVVDIETEDKDDIPSENIIDANDLPSFPWDDETYLPEVIDDKEPENTDEYTDIIPPILDNIEDLPISKDETNDSLNIDELDDLSDEENNQQALLDNPSSGFDLTPIFMLLLLDEDSDSDGLLDDWEMQHFGSLSYDADDDPDQDNLSNLGEYNNHTNPNNPDSDGDGLTDGWEVVNGLNPTSIDTDSDGLNDGYEITNYLDPKDPDMDDDNLLDGAEITAGTDPQDSDTDNDDLPDFWEVNSGTNPLVFDRNADLDSDLYSNYIEYILETDPDNVSSSPIPGSHHKYDDKGRLISSIALKNYQIECDIRYTYDMAGNRSTSLIR